jgi:hypothetical protein
MMSVRQYLGLVGFAFVALWIATSDFGDAILGLLGLAIFYLIGMAVEGDLDLGELQERVSGRRDATGLRR